MKKQWRSYVHFFIDFPLIHTKCIEFASYLSKATDIEFGFSRAFEQQFVLGSKLGEGAFGIVHEAKLANPYVDLELAVKIISKESIVTYEDFKALQQEVNIMKVMGGTLNVVHFYGAYENENNVYIVLERCSGGEIPQRIDGLGIITTSTCNEPSTERGGSTINIPTKTSVDEFPSTSSFIYSSNHETPKKDSSMKFINATREQWIGIYFSDILHVVWQCHLLKILHRDLKLENFLFAEKHLNNRNSPIKLIDFGGSILFSNKSNKQISSKLIENLEDQIKYPSKSEYVNGISGTPLYTAPEVLTGEYSYPSDIWSCGVILYVLLSGQFPFEDDKLLDERIQYDDIDVHTGPWQNVSSEAKDLVLRLLDRDPHQRYTAKEALEHSWIQQIRHQYLSKREARPLSGSIIQRLQFYHSLNGFQQTVLLHLTKLLPASETKELLVLFTELTEDVNKGLEIHEIIQAIRDGGYRLTFGEIKMLMYKVDLNGDGYINFHEFCTALLDWHPIQQQDYWHNLTIEVFNQFDQNKDGQICIEDIERTLPGRVLHVLHSDIQGSFEQADQDHNGSICLEEFQNMIKVDSNVFSHYSTRLDS